MKKINLAFVAAALLSLCTVATAGTINIQMTGLDLSFDGSTISSLTSPDTLTSVVVSDSAGGAPTLYGTGIDVDLVVPGVTLPVASPVSSATSAAGGSLVLNTPGGSLSLALDPVTVTHIDATTVAFTFGAGQSSIISQSLTGFPLADPVTVSFSTTINAGTLTNDGTNVTGFTAFGTGEITSVPEPAAGLTLLMGSLLGLVAVRRRK